MAHPGYHQFCPVAMAAEILGTRWTIVLLRELCAGSTRFNDLRRGVPRMSPALLSTRLRQLEDHGVLERRRLRGTAGTHEYVLTDAGRELTEVVMAIGIWGQRWVETAPSLENVDPALLMWDMRRNIRPEAMPERHVTVQFIYQDLDPSCSDWWLINDPDTGADLCSVDPGFEVDLYVHCDLKTMTAIWMGLQTVAQACAADRLLLVGAADLAKTMQDWLGLSPFAVHKKLVH